MKTKTKTKAKTKKTIERPTFDESTYKDIIQVLISEMRSFKGSFDRIAKEKNEHINRLEVDISNLKFREDQTKKNLMAALSKINTEPSVLLKEQIENIMQSFFNYIPNKK
jgi:hypothetical protein